MITGSFISRSLKNSTAKYLLDSGATTNFVDSSFVLDNCVTTTSLDEVLPVRLADGGSINCDSVVREVEIDIPGHHGVHDLVVIPRLDGCDAVLGKPFLRDAGAVIDCGQGTVSFSQSNNQRRRIRMADEGDEHVLDAADISELVAYDGDKVLRLLGMAAMEVGDEEAVATCARISAEMVPVPNIEADLLSPIAGAARAELEALVHNISM